MNGERRHDWRFVVAAVSGGHFFSHFYMLALPPLFPLLGDEFGLSNAQFGLLVAAVAVGGLLQLPVGGLVDRVGAKWVFVAGVGVTGGGLALVGLGESYPALVALAGVSGLGQAAFHPADYALIDAVTDPERQGRAFSVHTFSGYAGYAAAPTVVGALAIAADWRVALFAVGAVGVAYAAVAVLLLAPVYRERAHEAAGTGGESTAPAGTTTASDAPATEVEAGTDASTRSALSRPGILAMAAFFLLYALASKGLQTFTTVLAVDAFGLGEPTGNAMLSAFFAVGAVGVLVGGVLADRYPPPRVIAGTLAAGVTLLLAAVAGGGTLGGPVLVALFGLVGFATTIVMPSRDRIVSGLSARGSTGRSFGVTFTGGTVGGLGGPVLLGAVGDVTSLSLSFVLIGAAWLAAGAVALSLGLGWLAPASGLSATGGD